MAKLRKRKDILKEKETKQLAYKIVSNSFYQYYLIETTPLIDKRKLLKQEILELMSELKDDDE